MESTLDNAVEKLARLFKKESLSPLAEFLYAEALASFIQQQGMPTRTIRSHAWRSAGKFLAITLIGGIGTVITSMRAHALWLHGDNNDLLSILAFLLGLGSAISLTVGWASHGIAFLDTCTACRVNARLNWLTHCATCHTQVIEVLIGERSSSDTAHKAAREELERYVTEFFRWKADEYPELAVEVLGN